MFGDTDEEDEAFQLPTGGTRLASLFGQDQTATPGSENVSFQYKPPKQPKKGQSPTAAGLSTQKHPPAAVAAAPTAPAAAPAPTAAVFSVIFATGVHAHLFTNGKYMNRATCGVAIVGSHATKEYQVILYISKQQRIATARIHTEFVLTAQPNNYCTFSDDQCRIWSIMFESEFATMDFCKQLCIAKYNSNPSPDSVLYQDLVLGVGQSVEIGDALEITFTGWLLENGNVGRVFDSNVGKEKFLRMKLGSGKVMKGCEDGMIGLKKGGKRFIIVPPALGYGPLGEGERIPPDSTLAYEVEVIRVRFQKDAGSAGQSLGPRDSFTSSPSPQSESCNKDTACQTAPTPAPKPGEPIVRAKSSSISKQLANPDVTKAKLISRMAKMGQPMLPLLSSTFSSQQDDEEEPNTMHEVSTFSPNDSCPTEFPQQAVQGAGDVSSFLEKDIQKAVMEMKEIYHQSFQFIWKMADMLDQISAWLQKENSDSSLLSGASSASMETSAPMNEILQNPDVTKAKLISRMAKMGQPMLPLLSSTFSSQQDDKEEPNTIHEVSTFSPNDSHPTEFPQQAVQGAGDVSSFLERKIYQSIRSYWRMMDKFSSWLQKENSDSSLLSDASSASMETSAPMSEILQEIEMLKQKVAVKHRQFEEQKKKISEVTDSKQCYVEQSNTSLQLSEQSNTSLQMIMEHTQARILHFEQEKVRVTKELVEALAQISQLQKEVIHHQKQEMDLRSQLNEALTETERHKTQLNQLRAQLAELQSRYQEEKLNLKQLEEKVAALEKENLEKVKTMRSSETEKLSEQLEPMKGKVKKIMNKVFQSLRGQFNLEESYTGQEVLSIFLDTIKITTLQLLESQEERRGSSGTKEEGPMERKQPSAAPLYGDPQNNCLREPARVASPAPLPNLKENSNSAPFTALERTQKRLCSAAPEAHTLEAPGEQTPAASAQTTKPPLRLRTSIEIEKPSTQGETDTIDPVIMAPSTPMMYTTAPAVEQPTMGSEGEEERRASQNTVGPTSQVTPADKEEDMAGASQPKPGSRPMQADSRA